MAILILLVVIVAVAFFYAGFMIGSSKRWDAWHTVQHEREQEELRIKAGEQ